MSLNAYEVQVPKGNHPEVAPKQARSELSTKRLLQAAAELIGKVGYERATLAEIGKKAGYSHGLVTRRFGSKESLLYALLDQMVVKWAANEMMTEVSGHSGGESVVAIVDAIRASLNRSPREVRALYALMFEALKPIPTLNHTIASLHAGLRGEVEKHLARGIEDGSVRPDVDPQMMAGLVVAALRGCTYQWLLDSKNFDLDASLEALSEQVPNLIGPPRSSRRKRVPRQ